MGTSEQLPIGSEFIKRSASLHSKGVPDRVVALAEQWKSKNTVKDSRIKGFNSFQRLFEPADNVERKAEDGCMKKIKIERSLKLNQEDKRDHAHFDIISGKTNSDQTWIKAFGQQAKEAKLVEKPKIVSLDDMKNHWSETLK